MLILTRRMGETLCIGDDIKVTVLEVMGNQARIGIAAPRDVAVHREEIYDRIKGETPDEPAVSMADKTTPAERVVKKAIQSGKNRENDTRHRKPIITRKRSKLDGSGQIVEINGNF